MSPEVFIAYCYYLTVTDQEKRMQLWPLVKAQDTQAFIKFLDIKKDYGKKDDERDDS